MHDNDLKLALLPQEVFFVKIDDRPAGVAEKDLQVFARTQLEVFSPLPIEVLRWGICFCDKKLVTFAASADRLSRWKWTANALQVARIAVPFIVLLWKHPLRDGWTVFKRALEPSVNEFVAIRSEGGCWVNVAACSQASDMSDAEAVGKLSLIVSEKISGDVWTFTAEPASYGKVSVRLEKNGEFLEFKVGGTKFFERADIRDSVSLLNSRRKNFYARLGNGAISAGAFLLAVCIVWQASFFWQNSRIGAVNERVEELSPEAKKIMLMISDADFLDSINSKKMHNTLMLAQINGMRPEGVTYDKTIATSAKNIELRGKAQSVAILNRFETQLKEASFIKNVEKKISASQQSGSSWVMNIEFKD